jgi:hypothetical protein
MLLPVYIVFWQIILAYRLLYRVKAQLVKIGRPSNIGEVIKEECGKV